MSHLYGLTFFLNGKEHFSTEMRAEEQPLQQARHYVQEEQKNGVSAAVLVAQYNQRGMDLELLKIVEITNRIADEDPTMVLALGREREKTEQREARNAQHRQRQQPPRRKKKTIRGRDLQPGDVFRTTGDPNDPVEQLKGTGRALELAAARRRKKPPKKKKSTVFIGPMIEFGTGKNKRVIPLESAQRMAAQLEAAGKKSRPHKPRAHPSDVAGVLDQVRRRPSVRACRPKFQTGLVQISDMVREVARPHEVENAMDRFEACDWGDVSRAVTVRNNTATHKRRGKLFGQYPVRRGTIVILTEMVKTGNAMTFVALPEEVG